MRTRLLPLLLLALAPAAATPADEDLKADIGAGKALLAEGDARADRGETTEAVIRYKRAFEQLLPGLRGLPFRREVKRDVTERDDLRKVILKELDEDQTPEEFRGDELGMKALGLIPRDLDLKKTYVELYTEQIAAFYDPKTGTMHLVKEPAGPKAPKPGFLERLMGKKGGFDKDENKVTIAHELTHALADQHFGLDAMQAKCKGDDDRQLALSALVEGEATLAMMGAQMEDWTGKTITELPAADLDRVFRLLGPLMQMGGGPRLHEAPPVLSETLIFPYFRGLTFCATLTNAGGWKAVDAAYAEPPLSTEQILHPEKYRAKPDAPMTIDLPRLDPGAGWQEVGRNVVGEMQLAVMLRKHDGRTASAGWDGDAFATFTGPDDRLGLVWASTWDSEADAREFARAYARYQTTKLGPDSTEPEAFPDSLRRPRAGAFFAVERRGADVVVVEGFPSEATESLVEAAFSAKKAEKTHAPGPRAKAAGHADRAEGERRMPGEVDSPPNGVIGRAGETRVKRYHPDDLAAYDHEPKTLVILSKLNTPIAMPFESETALEAIIKYIKQATIDDNQPDGLPIEVDPRGMERAGVTLQTKVAFNKDGERLRDSLRSLLKQIGLGYQVKDGRLWITDEERTKKR